MQTRYQQLENRPVFQDLGDQEGWGFAFERSIGFKAVCSRVLYPSPYHFIGQINNSLFKINDVLIWDDIRLQGTSIHSLLLKTNALILPQITGHLNSSRLVLKTMGSATERARGQRSSDRPSPVPPHRPTGPHSITDRAQAR